MVSEYSTEPRRLPEMARSLRLSREGRRVAKHTRRARKQGLAGTLTDEEWLAVLEKHGWSCAFCGGPFESLEHRVPLHQGGGTTAQNCVPACISCNDLRDWVYRGIAGVEIARETNRLHVIADLLELS